MHAESKGIYNKHSADNWPSDWQVRSSAWALATAAVVRDSVGMTDHHLSVSSVSYTSFHMTVTRVTVTTNVVHVDSYPNTKPSTTPNPDPICYMTTACQYKIKTSILVEPLLKFTFTE